MPPALTLQTSVVQNEKEQMQLETDVVAAKLAGKEQALAAANICIDADDETITALQDQVAAVKDWLSFYRQQVDIARKEAKVCMIHIISSSSTSTAMFGQNCSRCML